MTTDLNHRIFMGFCGFMLKIPPLLSDRGARKGANGAKANAAFLSKEERNVHHFIVKKMAVVKSPIRAELIVEELGLSEDRVLKIIDKLESLKTFIFRSDGKGINWAYPLSLEDTGVRLTVSSGEQFFAA